MLVGHQSVLLVLSALVHSNVAIEECDNEVELGLSSLMQLRRNTLEAESVADVNSQSLEQDGASSARSLLSTKLGSCLGNDNRCRGSTLRECLALQWDGADCKFLPRNSLLATRPAFAEGNSYVIMTDAGSSKTKVNIFSYDAAGILIEEVVDPSIKIGPLAGYLGKPAELKKDFTELVISSKAQIPDTEQSSTPFYMLATAGMRTLSPEDQDSIYAVCTEVLKNSSVSPFVFEERHLRTMSGEEEASFTWLTVNYENPDCAYNVECPGSGTTGQLEMGGGSLQISFRPDPEIDILGNSWAINNHSVQTMLYSTSYMGYGQNDASDYALEMAARRHPNSDTIDYPCWLKGYSEIVTVSGRDGNQRDVKFKGTGCFDSCKKLTKEILHLDYDCFLRPCSIEGQYMAEVGSNRFVGMSAFHYAFANYNLSLTSSTPADLDAENRKFCSTPYDDVWHIEERYLSNQCFLGNYVYNVLTEALHFPTDTKQIVYDQDASWPLGAVLYEVLFQ
mmetsp:Transcript_113158/g.292697  ORF Transcript_113158/g.292697 Transcript_113158/m.292697 type:complete len:507 (-) Transcript_113158:25-1545(-)